MSVAGGTARAFACGIALLAACAPAARAADVRVVEAAHEFYIATFTAAPGETNDLTVSHAGGWVYFADAGAQMSAGPGCEHRPDGRVACETPVARFAIHPEAAANLGDMNDRGRAASVFDNNGTNNRTLAIDGGPGDDVLTGAGGADQLYGGLGADRIDGLGGADVLVGTESFDEGNLYDGDDVILGGTGADYVLGGGGEDWLEGGDGADTIEGDHWMLSGGGGRPDVLIGGSGGDRLTGQGGDDRLVGGTENDVLDGGWGSDEMDGGAGNDELDALDHRQGVTGYIDRITCGAGFDNVLWDIGDIFFTDCEGVDNPPPRPV